MKLKIWGTISLFSILLSLAILSYFASPVYGIMNQQSTIPETPTPIPTATSTPIPTPIFTSTPTRTGVTPIPPGLHINGNALDTTMKEVILIASIPGFTEPNNDPFINISNDGQIWSDWQRYTIYHLGGTDWSLSDGDGIKTVFAQFRNTIGDLSPIVSDTITLDSTVDQELGLLINDAAIFTNQITVTLTIGGRLATSLIQVSNEGGFPNTKWEPFTTQKTWTITQYGNYVIPRTVYVRYKNTQGDVSASSQDDIILDVNPPTGVVSVTRPTQYDIITSMIHSSTIQLNLSATDDVSGVAGMIISTKNDFSGRSWESFSKTKSLLITDQDVAVYVKFKDNAQNISEIYSVMLNAAAVKVFLPILAKGN